MMVKVLLYAYATGVFSSRGIARALEEDVAFRVWAAGNFPQHRTLCEFRCRHLEDTDGALRLNRSSQSCLNSRAQQTDFFHGLFGDCKLFYALTTGLAFEYVIRLRGDIYVTNARGERRAAAAAWVGSGGACAAAVGCSGDRQLRAAGRRGGG